MSAFYVGMALGAIGVAGQLVRVEIARSKAWREWKADLYD